jgi:hypothetical protein
MALFETKKEKRVYALGDNIITEGMKGQVTVVTDTNLTHDAKKFGVPHPFDYQIIENVYCEFGLVSAAVDKMVDFVWGSGFETKGDERAKKIIDQWMEDVQFENIGRQWLKQGLIKGFSPLELSGKPSQVPTEIKVLDADNVYIKIKKTGEIEKYVQKKPGMASTEIAAEFLPYEIAHLSINRVNDSPYGLGIVKQNMKMIGYFLMNIQSLHDLMRRKANAPIVAYMGNRDKDEYPSAEDVGTMQGKLQYMNNKTEWVVGDNMRMEVLQFGDLGKNFETALTLDKDMLIFGFQTPEVLLGKGNIPEGLAAVQLDAYERRAKSMQKEIERVIETKIFQRILVANGIDDKVQFIWGQPSKDEENKQIANMTALLNNPYINPEFQLEMQKKLARLMGIDVTMTLSKQQEINRTMNEPQARVPARSFYEGAIIHMDGCTCSACKKR